MRVRLFSDDIQDVEINEGRSSIARREVSSLVDASPASLSINRQGAISLFRRYPMQVALTGLGVSAFVVYEVGRVLQDLSLAMIVGGGSLAVWIGLSMRKKTHG